MNSEFNETLALRAVNSPGWSWHPGMLTLCNLRILDGDSDYLIGHRSGSTKDGGGWVDTTDVVGFLPDITDPATLGCLISLIQKTYKNKVVISIGNGWWSVQTDYKDWDQDNTDSFLDALVSVLETAP